MVCPSAASSWQIRSRASIGAHDGLNSRRVCRPAPAQKSWASSRFFWKADAATFGRYPGCPSTRTSETPTILSTVRSEGNACHLIKKEGCLPRRHSRYRRLQMVLRLDLGLPSGNRNRGLPNKRLDQTGAHEGRHFDGWCTATSDCQHLGVTASPGALLLALDDLAQEKAFLQGREPVDEQPLIEMVHLV